MSFSPCRIQQFGPFIFLFFYLINWLSMYFIRIYLIIVVVQEYIHIHILHFILIYM